MASDAERARELVSKLLHLGRNCDVEVYSVEIQSVAALLAQVRLEEARYIRQQTQTFHNSSIGVFFDVHIAELERAAGAEK